MKIWLYRKQYRLYRKKCPFRTTSVTWRFYSCFGNSSIFKTEFRLRTVKLKKWTHWSSAFSPGFRKTFSWPWATVSPAPSLSSTIWLLPLLRWTASRDSSTSGIRTVPCIPRAHNHVDAGFCPLWALEFCFVFALREQVWRVIVSFCTHTLSLIFSSVKI